MESEMNTQTNTVKVVRTCKAFIECIQDIIASVVEEGRMKDNISIAELATGRKHKAKKIYDTGYTCTAYFKGRDHKGTCCTGCEWWNDDFECPCAEGSKAYDGLKD